MAYFPSVFAVGEAVPGILAFVRPARARSWTPAFSTWSAAYDSRIDAMLPKQTDTALLIEFEGDDDAELDERFAVLRRHLDCTAALSLARATTEAETEHLWRVRKSAVALMQRMPGPRQPLPFIEDIAVHPTEVAACVDFLQKLFDREGVEAVMVGHVGDGNIHTRPVLDPKDPDDRVVMQRIYDEVSAYVLSVRGTMAGEHGDGLVHTPRLREMYGDEIYALFTRIKKAFDPGNVLNPGKKVGPQEPRHTLFSDVRYPEGYRTLPQETILHFADARATRARSSAATAARSARARSSPPCARSTRPHARSMPHRERRPTCCGPSSRATRRRAGRPTRRAPTAGKSPKQSPITASSAACAPWSARRGSTSPS